MLSMSKINMKSPSVFSTKRNTNDDQAHVSYSNLNFYQTFNESIDK